MPSIKDKAVVWTAYVTILAAFAITPLLCARKPQEELEKVLKTSNVADHTLDLISTANEGYKLIDPKISYNLNNPLQR